MDESARLIEGQFPSLAPIDIEWLGAGWDNVAYLVNGEMVFRFPRRRIGAACLETEIRFLPSLAPFLPLPVSNPLFVGSPEGEYPYPFAGYRLIRGSIASSVGLSDSERSSFAEPLGTFLRALHSVPPPHDAPGDEIRRADIAFRLPGALDRISKSEGNLAEIVNRLAGAAPYRGPAHWVHGDLHPRQFLISGGTISGVIDWGDMHAGDPAIDLAVAFTFLPPEARAAFGKAYGGIDDDTWKRACFRALYEGLIFREHGKLENDAESTRIAEFILHHIAD